MKMMSSAGSMGGRLSRQLYVPKRCGVVTPTCPTKARSKLVHG